MLVRLLDTLKSDAVRTCPLEQLPPIGATSYLLSKMWEVLFQVCYWCLFWCFPDYWSSWLQFLFFVDYHDQFVLPELVENYLSQLLQFFECLVYITRSGNVYCC